MAVRGPFVETRKRGEVGWIHEDLAELGCEPFWQALEPLPGVKGRGGVGLLTVGGRRLVVRPYRRGGALGSLLRDRYHEPARARRELEVLQELRLEGVPVVAPIAAVARRGRAFWRLRLCTEFLEDAQPVPAFLAEHAAMRRQCAEAVGLVVRLAFDAGLRHPDLHLDNVLCRISDEQEGKVRAVLVDLDRARLEAPLPERARDDMLVRMQRYVERHRGSMPASPSRAETMRFLRGLGLERGDRRELWRRIRERVLRQLGRRSWLRR